MKIYKKEYDQFVPGTIDEVWDFFSNPQNLNEITPKSMSFEIISGATKPMYPGMIIRYKIAPFLGIKMNWVTEISQVVQDKLFVDEQRFGPYKLWHHQHHFKEVEGGVQMKDLLHYAIPLGPIGRIANAVYVENQIDHIFEYRTEQIDRLFVREKMGA